MPINPINIAGGNIPKVRIEKITLSSGGKLVKADDPHIVETDLMTVSDIMDPNDEGVRSALVWQNWLNNKTTTAAAIQNTYGALVAEAEQELRSTPGIGGTSFSMRSRKLAIARLLQYYYRSNYPDRLHDQVAPESKVFRLNSGEEVTIDMDGRIGGEEGASLPDSAHLNFFLNQIPDPLVRHFESYLSTWLADTIYDPPAAGTLNNLSALSSGHGNVLLLMGDANWSRIGSSELAFLWSVVDKAYRRQQQLYAAERGTPTVQLATSIDGTAVRESEELTVDLLLSVKDIVSDANASWLESGDLAEYFEFVVLHTTSADVISSFKKTPSNQAAILEWFQRQGIVLNLASSENFITTRGAGQSDLKLSSHGPQRITELMATHMGSQSPLEQAPDGAYVRSFNFPLNHTFPTQFLPNLAFFILPYFNLAAFMSERVPGAPPVNRGTQEQYDRYLRYIIGAPSQDIVFANSKVLKSTSAFLYTYVDSQNGSQEQRVWGGPVHHHDRDHAAGLDVLSRANDNPAADPRLIAERESERWRVGYVGWMGGAQHDPSLTIEQARQQQPRLERISVPNNKIQDFRVMQRLERVFTDLSPLDVKAFDPEIKSPNNEQKVELLDSYFGEIQLTTDINKVVDLFCPFDVESFAKRETFFSTVWKNLTEDEKGEVFDYIQFEYVELKRRQVRDVSTHNRLGGLSADMPKIDEGDYEVPDTLLLSGSVSTGRTLIEAPNASFQDVTSFVQNTEKVQEVRDMRTLGRTKFLTFKDTSASNLIAGTYQYGIKLSILDRTPLFLKRRREILSSLLRRLNTYYSFTMEKTNYEVSLDRIPPFVAESLLHGGLSVRAQYRFFDSLHNDIASTRKDFVKTLRLLSADASSFDASEVSQTLRTFLDPMTATRDTIYRVVKVLGDLLDKIDHILGASSVPSTGNSTTSQVRTPTAGKKLIKTVEIEQFSTTLFDANYPRTAGYYYMSPLFESEPRTGGIRRINRAQFLAAQNIERRKSFYQTVNSPLDPLIVNDVSSFTPLYVTVPKIATNIRSIGKIPYNPQDSTDRVRKLLKSPFTFNNRAFRDEQGVNGASARLLSQNGVELLAHYTEPAEGQGQPPAWHEQHIKYNAMADMVHILNLTRGEEGLVQGLDGTDKGLKAGLSRILSPQGCTIIAPGHAGGLIVNPDTPHQDREVAPSRPNNRTGFSPSINIPGQALVENLNVDGVVRTTPGDSNVPNGFRELEGNPRNVIEDYQASFGLPSNINPAAVFRTILEAEKKVLGSRSFAFIRNSEIPVEKGFFDDFGALPIPMKLLGSLYTKGFARRSQTVIPRWHGPSASDRHNHDETITVENVIKFEDAGFFDIHFNKIMKVQVLTGYQRAANTQDRAAGGHSSASDNVLVDRPIWRTLQPIDLAANSICRLVPYENAAFDVGQPEYLDMPVFDSIFMVEGDGDTTPIAVVTAGTIGLERQLEEGGSLLMPEGDPAAPPDSVQGAPPPGSRRASIARGAGDVAVGAGGAGGGFGENMAVDPSNTWSMF